ncbi:MAG: HlyC/CorC family transporter [Micavibrio aeruginosavorus]|nr:HlyC/CorC family transporter [Micavibrio aeruginosavorus]
MDMEFWISLVAIFFLLVASAFFSASETGLTGASRARLHTLAQAGNRRAALVNAIREKKDRMIGTLLLGNNAVNILASALATNILIKMFGDFGVLYATGLMTVVILIFSEVMPKTYALYHADKVAMAVSPVLRVLIAVFSPVSHIVTVIVDRTLRVFGTDVRAEPDVDNTDELRGIIDLHHGEEEAKQEQKAMLRSILDLADVWVEEIMTHRNAVQTIDLDQPLEQIVQEILDSQYTRIPVWSGTPDNIVGVIHAKALLRELQNAGGTLKGVDVAKLASEPWYIPDSTTLFDQLQAFRQRREHFALVVDEYGTLMGVVTLEDILEEIVGKIDDEHDITVAGVRKQPNGSYMIDGTVTIRDLNREFNWNLPSEHYATLAGLVLYEAQKLPEPGQVFNFHGFRFDIVRRQRNQVTLIRVTPPKDGEEVT